MKKSRKKSVKPLTLTIRQKRCCDIYHSMEKPNKRIAYELAGYEARGKTARTEAQRMMDLPHVKVYLDSLKVAATEKARKSADEIIAELEKVGFNKGWGEKAKVRSLELLGRRYGLFPVKQELTGKDGGPIEAKVTVIHFNKKKK